jgi:Asp-tRNA(Asn)/Glu-tRNA(Gln) amidotransferase C subunit
MFQDEKSIVDPAIVLEKLRDGNAKVCLNSETIKRDAPESVYKYFHTQDWFVQ